MSDVPEGLHVMQYGLHILEFTLGWPAKGNAELMADCLTALQKAKSLTAVQAYKYMLRAIGLAKEQNVTVDRMFFMNGEYSSIRPTAKPVTTAGCDAECKSRHGRGYHENDVKWVLRNYIIHVKAGGHKTPWDFFDELDKKRAGGPPEWR